MHFSLVRKLVLGIIIVSITTYSTSAFFIFQLKPLLAPNLEEWIYISGVLLLGIFWTGLLGWIAAQLIVRPLLHLTNTVNTVASGDLNVSLPDYQGRDEIGTLHRSFRVMLDNLRNMISDVTDSVAVTDKNVTMLGTAIKQATEQIETIVLTIEQMADGASNQADSANHMVQSAEQTAESAQKMNAQAERAIHISEKMVTTITESADKLRSLVDGMIHIAETSDNNLSIVRKLEQQAKEISHISQIVSELADQTHLLALNASIEAAHVGEHGTGFAVVAQQIRHLATDSATAGEQISKLVSDMQKLTLTVVNETDKQVQLIHQEKKTGEKAKGTLDEIIASVDETAHALHHIVQNVAQQTKQIDNTFERAKQMEESATSIREGSSRISSSAQEQMSVMQEISASSELLQHEADRLKQKATLFKL